jgi:cytochrome P450
MSNDNRNPHLDTCPGQAEVVDLAKATLADPELARCPFGFYAALRENAPVRRDPQLGHYWVARRADVIAAAQDSEHFSSKSDLQLRSRFRPRAQKLWDDAGINMRYTLLTSDPPEHAEFRRFGAALFTPRKVQELAPHIENIVNGLIDGFIDDGTVEFLGRFAALLPATVVADEYGFPRSDRERFKYWTDGVIQLQTPSITEDEEVDLVQRVIELFDYLVSHLEKAVDEPTGRVIYDLATFNRTDGTPFTMLERAWMALIIFVAGNETTVNTLCSAVYRLAGDSMLQETLRADPSKIENFVEETLRYEPSVQVLIRKAASDVKVGAETISAGADVVLCTASANRDEAYWTEPNEFRIDRPNHRQHLTFGYGRHVCVGMHLARRELVCAIRILLERLDKIRFQDPKHLPSYLPMPFFRGMASLPIMFEKHQ